MSYCRWSSDNWRCDVYCYEDCDGGWKTHVASNKLHGIPIVEWPEENTQENMEKWASQIKAQMEAVGKAEMIPIGLPCDGESYNDPTLEEFKERLCGLKAMGYNVPSYVFEIIEEEVK